MLIFQKKLADLIKVIMVYSFEMENLEQLNEIKIYESILHSSIIKFEISKILKVGSIQTMLLFGLLR